MTLTPLQLHGRRGPARTRLRQVSRLVELGCDPVRVLLRVPVRTSPSSSWTDRSRSPFVSDSRQVTRRKIINWRTSLSFPVKPKMSPECQHLIAALLCEPGDRLGATRPVTRAPNAVLVQNRTPPRPAPQALEGAAAIKAHPWFASIDFETLHLQTPPFVPQLRAASDTQYFEDNIDPNPLAAPDAGLGGLGGDSTKDPMLRVPELLEIRKQLAFQASSLLLLRGRADDGAGLDVQESRSVETGVRSASHGRSIVRCDGCRRPYAW